MLEDMNLSVNGHSKVPPGFRFHPTEEELLHYYLRKKVACQKIDLDVIRDVDLNKLEPWDIQETCKIGSTPQNDWYFFSHKDKKYPTGTRTNRATAAGFWKATGRDKVIHNSMRRIGMRKTLVFYRGRAPHGLKSDWIMHEYRLDLDNDNNSTSSHESTAYNAVSNLSGDSGSDEGWVVCRVFKKKNYHKSIGHSPLNLSTSSSTPRNEGVLDHILTYMGRSSSSSSSCKQENESNNIPLFSNLPSTPGFMHLPGLECPSLIKSPSSLAGEGLLISEIGPSSDWAAVDRLVASQLNGQPTKPFSCTSDDDFSFCFDQHDDEIAHDEAQLLNTMMFESDYKVVPSYDHHLHVPNSSDATHLWDHFGQPSSSSLSSSTSDPLCRFSV